MVLVIRLVIYYFIFFLIILCLFDLLYEHAIAARAKLGQCVLEIEGMLVTICTILSCTDYNLTLSITTTLWGDHATLNKLKENLKEEKN